jgi:uncharacterized membrane protein
MEIAPKDAVSAGAVTAADVIVVAVIVTVTVADAAAETAVTVTVTTVEAVADVMVVRKKRLKSLLSLSQRLLKSLKLSQLFPQQMQASALK